MRHLGWRKKMQKHIQADLANLPDSIHARPEGCAHPPLQSPMANAKHPHGNVPSLLRTRHNAVPLFTILQAVANKAKILLLAKECHTEMCAFA